MKKTVQSNQMLRLLFWETTIKCNLACAHCRRLESDEAVVTDLSTSKRKELIEQLAELGKGQPMMPVLVFSGGEPLCRDDIFELIDYAKSLGITPALAIKVVNCSQKALLISLSNPELLGQVIGP